MRRALLTIAEPVDHQHMGSRARQISDRDLAYDGDASLVEHTQHLWISLFTDLGLVSCFQKTKYSWDLGIYC